MVPTVMLTRMIRTPSEQALISRLERVRVSLSNGEEAMTTAKSFSLQTVTTREAQKSMSTIILISKASRLVGPTGLALVLASVAVEEVEVEAATVLPARMITLAIPKGNSLSMHEVAFGKMRKRRRSCGDL